jgi:hypothetical protein
MERYAWQSPLPPAWLTDPGPAKRMTHFFRKRIIAYQSWEDSWQVLLTEARPGHRISASGKDNPVCDIDKGKEPIMKKPDLLILVAIWEFFTAFWAMIGMAAIAIFAYPAVLELDRMEKLGAMFGLTIGMLVLFIALVVGIAGGIGLIMGKEWGRVLSLIRAALSLLSVPIGTIIGILVILYLIKPEVKEYFQSAQA